MKHFLLTYFLGLASIFVQAQLAIDCSTTSDYIVCDNFTDGDFTNNPSWIGDTDKFAITSEQLVINAGEAGSVVLATSNLMAGTTEWQFYFKLDFDPSTSNNIKVYLSNDAIDLNGNGYYLQIGESGTTDAIKLMNTNSSDVLLTSPEGSAADNPEGYVRVVRTADGTWELLTALSGATDYTSHGTVLNNDFTTSSYLGVKANFTASNADNAIFFDDFYSAFTDNIAPEIVNISPSSDGLQLTIEFSEAVAPWTINELSNFVLNGASNPIDASSIGTNVLLTFATPFTSGNLNSIEISNITDLIGNTISPNPSIQDFFFYLVSYGDVVINEIYADNTIPSDVSGIILPDTLLQEKFVELYNTTEYPISLLGWYFTDLSSDTIFFPNEVISANDYLILCDVTAVSTYGPYGHTFGSGSFPSPNVGGDALTLALPNSTIVNDVSYESNWYLDGSKDEGGWSLELINPLNPCSDTDNWRASIDSIYGATPGTQNSIYNPNSDTQAPTANVVFASSDTLQITFDEFVTLSTALEPTNYGIDNGITIIDVLFDGEAVLIALSTPLTEGINYVFTVNGVSDCIGNATNQTVNLLVPQASEPFDVLVNELFADLTPKTGFDNALFDIPEVEYIELYNRSDKNIDLGGWLLIDSKPDTAQFDNYLLAPQSYVVVCANSSLDKFPIDWPVVSVTNFPSLNDDSDDIVLVNAGGTTIHTVNYNRDWYGDDIKKEGQWSLELIDPSNPCEGENNWRASIDPRGGTPSIQNSVFASNPDETVPDLLRAEVVSANSVQLFFSEILGSNTVISPANYTISPELTVNNAYLPADNLASIIVQFNQSMADGSIYTISLSDIADCAGNVVGLFNEIQFGVPQVPDTNDIIINEILFNPATGGADFIEIYNRSDKAIDLYGWCLANADVNANPDSLLTSTSIVEEQYTMLPKQFIVLTKDIKNVISQYNGCDEDISTKTFIDVSTPSFNDSEGVVAIVNCNTFFGENRLDYVHYYATWHHEILDDKNGVSLERISYDAPSNDANNWQTAAKSFCYATPGYTNSQTIDNDATLDSNITITPTTFSPDGDGIDDFTLINYNFNENALTANVYVFDSRGREVKHLAKSDILSEQGSFKWDGTTAQGNKAPIGIYIIYVEVFNLTGDVQTFKETIVLAGKLE